MFKYIVELVEESSHSQTESKLDCREDGTEQATRTQLGIGIESRSSTYGWDSWAPKCRQLISIGSLL